MICAAWHMLTTGEIYNDLGGDYYTRRNPERQTKRLIAQLERLGHTVTLQEARPRRAGPQQADPTQPQRLFSWLEGSGDDATVAVDRNVAPTCGNCAVTTARRRRR